MATAVVLWPRLKRRPPPPRRCLVRDNAPRGRLHDLIQEVTSRLGRPVDLFTEATPRFSFPLSASSEATSPTAARTDLSAEEMIPTAVSWPRQHRRAELSLPFPPALPPRPSSVATSLTAVRANLSAEAMTSEAIPWSRPQRRATPPPRRDGVPNDIPHGCRRGLVGGDDVVLGRPVTSSAAAPPA